MAKLVNIQTQGLPLKTLELGALQLRKFFNEERLNELVSSLKEKGILQPILVRTLSEKDGKKYEVIIGARRLKAAQIAGFKEIPAYVIEKISDPEALEMALTENLQREDLTPFEEAWGILRLMKEYQYSIKDITKKLNKSDSFVRSRLTLLRLPETVQKYVSNGKLTMETALPLAKLDSPEKQIEMTERIVSETLTGDEAKEMVKAALSKQRRRKKELAPQRVATEWKEVESQSEKLIMLLENLDIHKISFPTRENIKAVLSKLRKVVTKVLQEIEHAD